jgi:hypothetical protein
MALAAAQPREELFSTPLPRPGRGGNRAPSPDGSSIGTGRSRARRAVAVANGQVEVDEAKDLSFRRVPMRTCRVGRLVADDSPKIQIP